MSAGEGKKIFIMNIYHTLQGNFMEMFDIIINIFENYLLGFLCYILMTKKENRSIISVFVLGGILTIETMISNHYINYDYFLDIVTNATIIIFAFYYSKDSLVYKLTISFIPLTLLYICNTSVFILFSFMYQLSISKLISGGYYVSIVIVSKMIFAFFAVLIYYMKQKGYFNDFHLISNSWWPIVMISFHICVVIDILLGSLYTERIAKTQILITLFALLFIMISLCILFRTVQKENLEKSRMNLQLELFKNDRENYKHDLDFFKQLKTMKHDMKHVYIYIGTLIQAKDYTKLNEVIKKNVELLCNDHDYKITNHSIFDMVLKHKLSIAEQKNIEMNFDIRIPDTLPIDDQDLYILLSNLLDNAIENCDEKKALISVSAEFKNRNLIIIIRNTIKNTVLAKNKNLNTTKKDKKVHGYGISSVKSIVNKNSGFVSFYEEGNFFVCKVILKVK